MLVETIRRGPELPTTATDKEVKMRASFRSTAVALALLCVFSLTLAPVQAKKAVYYTGFDEWLAAEGDFSDWQRSGVRLSKGGELALHRKTATWETDPYPLGAYYEGGNFYTGGSYWVGEATGPAVPTAFDFDELIPSWNATTPTGTWVEILVRAELDGIWTQWYNLGIWASGSDTIQRHSVRDQRDDYARVAVDTLVISDDKAIAAAYQLKVRLFSVDGVATPSVRYLSAATSTEPTKNSEVSEGNPAYWNTLLDVPQCSQMVYEGGNVWCSPTSTAMIVSYWQNTGDCAEAVMAAVDGIYDWVYGGTGNWPFNTAYAATYGLQGSVRRFSSMNEIEYWVAQGVPVAFSYSWGKGQLDGAAVNSSSGHLSVVVGFDVKGNPIVNDPAADPEEGEVVQRTYLRSELEPLWLENSGGVVYLIKP
jgi:hypothetical protein